MLPIPSGEATGKLLLSLIAPEDHSMVCDRLTLCCQGEITQDLEVRLQSRAGQIHTVLLTMEAVQDAAGQIAAVRWLMRDITKRKHAEIELARANALLTSLSHMSARVETNNDPEWMMRTLGTELAALELNCVVALIEPDTEALRVRFVWTEQEALAQIQELYGAELVGARISRERFNFFPQVVEWERSVFTADGGSVLASLLTGAPRKVVKRAQVLAGITPETRAMYLPLRVEEQVIGIMGIWGEELREPDISVYAIFASELASALENARLSGELERQRAQLQALSARLVTVLEDERRRIARELHDQAGQLLYGLRLHLDVLARQIPNEQSELQLQVGALHQLLEEARQKIKKLSHQLRPATLDELGLEPALYKLVNEFGRQAGLNATFEASGINGRLAAPVEAVCYRIVQEALTNVALHAEARYVTVNLAVDDGLIQLQVLDDGCGFDPHQPRTKGLGLVGIEERAMGLGGSVLIHSTPSTGTSLQVTLPNTRHQEYEC